MNVEDPYATPLGEIVARIARRGCGRRGRDRRARPGGGARGLSVRCRATRLRSRTPGRRERTTLQLKRCPGRASAEGRRSTAATPRARSRRAVARDASRRAAEKAGSGGRGGAGRKRSTGTPRPKRYERATDLEDCGPKAAAAAIIVYAIAALLLKQVRELEPAAASDRARIYTPLIYYTDLYMYRRYQRKQAAR